MAALAGLSVVVSASQLADYSISIIKFLAEIHNRLQNAPRQYREYEQQLQLLVSTARSIEQNPALQVADIQSHLEAILVDVRALQLLLCSPATGSIDSSPKRKYWNAITGVEERRITTHLDSLQQKNIGLLLSISTVNTTQLSSVQGSVDKLIDMSSTLSKEQRKTASHNTAANSTRQWLDRASMQLEEGDNTALVLAGRQNYPTTTNRQAEPLGFRSIGGSYYKNIKIGAKSNVTNGDIFSGTGNGSGTPNNPMLDHGNTYGNIDIGANSNVHNGTTGLGTPSRNIYEEMSIGESSYVVNAQIENLETKKRVFTQRD